MKIAVIGAYGYTGQLICDELSKANIRFSIAGKNEALMHEMVEQNTSIDNCRLGDITSRQFIDLLCEEFDCFINCAGPFEEESIDFLKAACENGKIYLDICGELGFIKRAKEMFAAKALESGAIIIQGCAFESLPTDLLIQHLSKEKDFNGVNTYYWFNQKRVSPGTRMTMKLANNKTLYKVKNGEWAAININEDKRKVQWSFEPNALLAVPYPLPEVAFSQWNFELNSAANYLLLAENEGMFMQGAKQNDEDPKKTLERLKKIKKPGPSESERQAQKSKIIVELLLTDNSTYHQMIENTDMYGTTAKAINKAIQNLCSNKPNLSGFVSPAKLFRGVELETLSELNCSTDNQLNFSVSNV